jgi:DNA-binding CsgD family transcriptional regulator
MIENMPRVSSPVFVGRAAELERLCRALDRATDGERPALRLVAGEAGIGKTRLIGEFAGRAEASGARVLAGDCMQLGETGLPYAPFVGALRPLVHQADSERDDLLAGAGRAELSRLFPELATHPEPRVISQAMAVSTSAQARLFEVILGLLRRLASERPLVLVLEDLHWADPSTRDLLRFLARNARSGRLLVIGSYRSDELHRRHPLRPLLVDLLRLEGVERIELAAFGAQEVAEQIAAITGSPPDGEVVGQILARSGGNPFLAEELIAAGATEAAMPRGLRDMIEDRVRRLAAPTQAVLRAASVGGQRIDHELLEGVAGLPAPDMTAALREAVEHHLLVASGPHEAPGYAFRHALVQEVVYDDLLPNERTQLHAAYAVAIESHPYLGLAEPAGVSAQLAQHWLLAHDVPRALSAAVAAARAAVAGSAFAEAQVFLERALELWPKVPAAELPEGIDRVGLLEEAAEAAAQAGDSRRAIDLVQSALDEIDAQARPMRAGVLHHRLSTYLNESGDWEAGAATLERAVQLIPIDPPTPERARVVADLAQSYMVRSRFSESLALAEAALAVSRMVGAPIAEARALNAMGLDFASRSDLLRGIATLREAYAVARRLGDPQSIFLTAVGLGWTLDEAARHDEALRVCMEARDRLIELGAGPRYAALLASKMGRDLYELGRWSEARTLLDDEIAARPIRYAMRWLLSNRTRLAIHAGRLDEARADIAAYDSLGERVIGPDPDHMEARRAELAIADGRFTAARTVIAETIDRLVEPDLDADGRSLALIGLRAEVEEAEEARATGDARRAGEAATVAGRLAEQVAASAREVHRTVAEVADVIDADVALAAALGATAEGRADPAVWEAAVEGRRRVGRPFELASALAQLAASHLAARRRDDAATVLAEAHPIAADLGAHPLRTRVEGLARRARIGLEGVETADDTATRLGLTEREREVLALLAEGRSNRQIGESLYMAESTAGVHVSNILGKLGVGRRSEAAALAQRLGLFRLP